MDDNDVMKFLKMMAENERQRFVTLTVQLTEVSSLLKMLYCLEKLRIGEESQTLSTAQISVNLDALLSKIQQVNEQDLAALYQQVGDALRPKQDG